MLSIRPLLPGDLARYRALRLRGLAEHPEAFTSSVEEESSMPPDKLARRLEPGADAPHDVVLGAFDGDTLVGVCGLSVDRRAKVRHRGRVFGMYVPRERAGRGTGRRLVDALLAHARRYDGLDALVLTVTASNDPARTLYEHAGFTVFGREPGAVRVAGQPHDKLHMIRWLETPEPPTPNATGEPA